MAQTSGSPRPKERSATVKGTRMIEAAVLSFQDNVTRPGQRCVPIECPVAFEFNGIGYAVMMGTPTDLEDFAIGFAISEGLAEPHEIGEPEITDAEGGFVVRCNLPASSLPRLMERARTRVSESGCGICGIDSIAAALAPLPRVGKPPSVAPGVIHDALEAVYDHQQLGRATGASHAATWCSADGRIMAVREDVGRHNALDKLIGALARSDANMADGFILLSARCSQELVEKTIRAGAPMLVTISAPSSLAVDRAAEGGLTLIALARSDTALVLNDPHGLFPGE